MFESYEEREKEAIAELKRNNSVAYEILGEKIHGLGHNGAVDRVKAMDKIPRPALKLIRRYFDNIRGAGIYIGEKGVFSALSSAPSYNSEPADLIEAYKHIDYLVLGAHSLVTGNVYLSSKVPDDYLDDASIVNHELGHVFQEALTPEGFQEFGSRFVDFVTVIHAEQNHLYMRDYYLYPEEGFAQLFSGWSEGYSSANIEDRIYLILKAMEVGYIDPPKDEDELTRILSAMAEVILPIIEFFDAVVRAVDYKFSEEEHKNE